MIDIRNQNQVAVASDAGVTTYPAADAAPFHPSESYPEYAGDLSSAPNPVYGMVRRVLADLGLDKGRFGTASWNPIGDLVQPGERIVLKPNWVLHRNLGPGGTDCLVTHASVLRAVLDYAFLAQPREVVVGDAPIQDCDFEALANLGARQVVEWFAKRGMPVRLADFRRTTLREEAAAVTVRENLQPIEKYVTVDLGNHSMLEPIAGDAARFRVTKYDPRRMPENQRPGVHRYLIAKDVLDAGLVINLPKLKTHKKAGITAALKNLVGINGNKDFLPHHRKGSAPSGGDNYERRSLLKFLAEQVLDFANRHLDRPRFYSACNRLIYYLLVANMKLGGDGDVEGGWHGNDTVWRMCLDLNRVLLYSNRKGRLCEAPQRAVLSLADGIVAGEGEGPLKSDPRAMGIILGAYNPAAADWVSSLLMGFPPERIPIVNNAFVVESYALAAFAPDSIRCSMNGAAVDLADLPGRYGCHLVPPRGWKTYLGQSSTTGNGR
jgi:uncharacterized protein (DUF362 family)